MTVQQAEIVQQADTVDKAPQCVLRGWLMIQFGDESCHLVGFNPDTRRGRVSTPVEHLDRDNMTAVTSSGRTYVLADPQPGDIPPEDILRKWIEETKYPADLITVLDTEEILRPSLH